MYGESCEPKSYIMFVRDQWILKTGTWDKWSSNIYLNSTNYTKFNMMSSDSDSDSFRFILFDILYHYCDNTECVHK